MPRNERARRAVWGVLLLFMAFPVPGLGRNEPPKTRVEVSGRVRLVGSGPNTELVITGKDREWHISPRDRKKLMKLQQQIVRVRGKEYFTDLRFANGRPAGRRYILEDITLMKPETEEASAPQ